MTRREIQWTTVVRKTEKTEMTENGRVFALMHMLHLCLDNNNNLSEQKKNKTTTAQTDNTGGNLFLLYWQKPR